jgi:hypothetical protein
MDFLREHKIAPYSVLDCLQTISGDAEWALARKGGALKRQPLSVAARDVMLQWIGDSMGDEAVKTATNTFPLASSNKAIDVLSDPECERREADNDFFRSFRF